MKKYLILSIGFLIGLSSFASISDKDGYDITVKINGLSCEEDLLLANYYGDKQYIRDSSECINGVFHFKGEERLETGIYMIVLPKKNYFEMVISIHEDQTKYYFENDTLLIQEDLIVKGSRENQVFHEFNLFATAQGKKAGEIEKELKLATDDKKKEKLKDELRGISRGVVNKRREVAATNQELFIGRLYSSMQDVTADGKEPEGLEGDELREWRYLYVRDHYFDNIDKSEDGLVRSPIFHNMLKDYFTNYVPPIPDTAIMLADRVIGQMDAGGSKEMYKYTIHFLLGHFEKLEYMCFDKAVWHMAKNYYCAGKAFWSDSAFTNKMCVESAKMEPTLCDKVAPDMSMPDSTFRRRHTLSQIESPVTIVILWDIDCGHCKKEMPIISAYYDSANKEHVEIYAVYTKSDWDGWKKRLKEENYKFINVGNAFGEDDFRTDYNIVSTPQIYILDKDKKIIFKKIGAKDIPGAVTYLLEEQGIIEKQEVVEEPEKSDGDGVQEYEEPVMEEAAPKTSKKGTKKKS